MIPRVPSLLTRLSSGFAVALEGALFGVDDLLTHYHDARDASALRGELAAAVKRIAALTERAEAAERHTVRAMRDGAEAVNGWTRTGKDLAAAEETLATVYWLGWMAIVERDINEHVGVSTRRKLREAEKRIAELTEPRKTAAQWENTPCVYCGEESEDAAQYAVVRLCRRCGEDDSLTLPIIRARVKLRAESCPSRRDGGDPHAKGCNDCEAWPGTPCRKDRCCDCNAPSGDPHYVDCVSLDRPITPL